VPDALFSDARLAAIYDHAESDRRDLDVYVALVEEFNAESVLDIGCGTGSFASLLAERGMQVIGVDPAAASLEVGRRKAHARCVRWLLGDATKLPKLHVDIVTTTGNVAQVFLSNEEWAATLDGAFRALRAGGRLVFEVRDPAREEWLEWTPDRSYRRIDAPEVGTIETWTELSDVSPPFISFRSTYVLEDEGTTLTSDSTLRFRKRAEIDRALTAAGFALEGVRDAPDRPGHEFVFIARKATSQTRGRVVRV
jgi:SAM-dependent methyltransferase